MNNYHNYNKPCGCKEKKVPCGCEEPQICGCSQKYDFLCSFYSGNPLNPIGIEPGMDGNTVVRMLVNYIDAEIADISFNPTVIKSIGDKIDIYKGLSDNFVHEIKSIQGQPNGGVIVENVSAVPGDCNSPGDYINVKIDENWLRNYLLENICGIIVQAGCSVTPPVHNPVTTDIIKSTANRTDVILSDTDFTSHFTDSLGHTLGSISLTGPVTGYSFNNAPYVVGTELTLAQITAGTLKYTPDNIDTLYTKTVTYKAKDSVGSVSNNSSIIINVAAKVFLVFNTPTVALIRSVPNSVPSTIGFINGTGQNMANGHVLVNQGTVGQPGYLKVMTTAQTTLSGTGVIPVIVESVPTASQANQTVSYTFDGSTGNINLTYNSNPATQDVIVDLDNRDIHTFTTQEFLTKYTDFDGDTMTEMRATGNVSNYLFNGVPYVSGTWIPVNNIDHLSYTGANQNAAYQQITPWSAKDAQGNIST